jgi:hypothetical protein
MALFMVECDAEALDTGRLGPELWPLFSRRRGALVRVDRRDLIGDRAAGGACAAGPGPLAHAVRERVRSELGRAPDGRVRVLTLPRVLGFVFNPVTFYLCEDRSGGLDAIVAEITNTPWGERHAYVLDARAAGSGVGRAMRFGFDKRFHVSPFLPMDLGYEWVFSRGCADAGGSIGISMRLAREGHPMFDATLALRRTKLTPASLVWQVLRCPLLTLGVVARIYLDAALLWLKGVPVYAHPPRAASTMKEAA